MSSSQTTSKTYVDHVALSVTFKGVPSGRWSSAKMMDGMADFVHKPVIATSAAGQMSIGGKRLLTNGRRVWRATSKDPLPRRRRKVPRHGLDNQMTPNEKDALHEVSGNLRPSRWVLEQLRGQIVTKIKAMTASAFGTTVFPLLLHKFEMYIELPLTEDVTAMRKAVRCILSSKFNKITTHTDESADGSDAYEYWSFKSLFMGRMMATTIKVYKKGELLRIEVVFDQPKLAKDWSLDQDAFFAGWLRLEEYGASLLHEIDYALKHAPHEETLEIDLVMRAIHRLCPHLGLDYMNRIRDGLSRDGIVLPPSPFQRHRKFHYAMGKMRKAGVFQGRKKTHRSADKKIAPASRGTEYILTPAYAKACLAITDGPRYRPMTLPAVVPYDPVDFLRHAEASRLQIRDRAVSRMRKSRTLVDALQCIISATDEPWCTPRLEARHPTG